MKFNNYWLTEAETNRTRTIPSSIKNYEGTGCLEDFLPAGVKIPESKGKKGLKTLLQFTYYVWNNRGEIK